MVAFCRIALFAQFFPARHQVVLLSVACVAKEGAGEASTKRSRRAPGRSFRPPRGRPTVAGSGPKRKDRRMDGGDGAGTPPADTSSRLKVHSSSVIVTPPFDLWEPIQELRRRVADPGLARWMPHINMLYPFVPTAEFPAAVSTIEAALSSVEPFRVRLGRFAVFEHKRSATLWLAPEAPPGTWDALQAALQGAVPHCNDQTARHGGVFTPHLTMSHFAAVEHAHQWADMLSSAWEPIEFDVTSVAVVARLDSVSPFHFKYFVPLGSGAREPIAPVDIPYQHPPVPDGDDAPDTLQVRTLGAALTELGQVAGAGPAEQFGAWLESTAESRTALPFLFAEMNKDDRRAVHAAVKHAAAAAQVRLVSDTTPTDEVRVHCPRMASDRYSRHKRLPPREWGTPPPSPLPQDPQP